MFGGGDVGIVEQAAAADRITGRVILVGEVAFEFIAAGSDPRAEGGKEKKS